MKKTLFLIAALLLLGGSQAQVKWQTIDAASKSKIGEKMYLVDFYTDWCGYCKKMDRETFNDPTVIKIIKKYFFPVKFNAEGSNSFDWFGQTYRPATNGRNRTHEFARGVRGYPTIALYKADGTLFQAIPGYNPPKDFVVILWYLVSGDYNRYSFERYSQIFDKEIRPKMEKELDN